MRLHQPGWLKLLPCFAPPFWLLWGHCGQWLRCEKRGAEGRGKPDLGEGEVHRWDPAGFCLEVTLAQASKPTASSDLLAP